MAARITLNAVKLGLAGLGIAAGTYGALAGHRAAVWVAIGLLTAAFVLRFTPRPDRGAGPPAP